MINEQYTYSELTGVHFANQKKNRIFAVYKCIIQINCNSNGCPNI
jgi:hypothetical protein